MKKDDNSGVSIKQIMLTTIFLTVITLGGLGAYGIVNNNGIKAIPDLESAGIKNEESKWETALVENTEDDFVDFKKIEFMAAKVVDGDSVSSSSTNTNQLTFRGNYIRDISEKEVLQSEILEGKVLENEKINILNNKANNKLLDTVLSNIKELSEKQNDISDKKEDNENDDNGVKKVDINETSSSIVSEPVISEAVSETVPGVVPEKIESQVSVSNSATDVPTEYVRTLDVKATAYCLCKKCCGKNPSHPDYGITASGLKITPGTGMKVVASDPKVIPLGTKVYIEGLYGAKDYGYATVADTGSAIKNMKIDLYMDTHQMALNWGVKTVRVYICE